MRDSDPRIVEHLKALRDQGWSWPALSRKTGVSKSTLQRWARGQGVQSRALVEDVLAVKGAPPPRKRTPKGAK